MRFERSYEVKIPAVPIPETRVFAHATRMSDFASPEIERILKPASELRQHTVTIEVRSGNSLTAAENHPVPTAAYPRLKHEIKSRLHQATPVVNLGDQYGLDMRFRFLGNYAHLIHDVIGPVRLIERTLEADANAPTRPVHVIMPKNAPPLAKKVLDFAGIPTLATDGAVTGDLISITQELNLTLLSHLRRQPVEAWSTPTPERVFVARRGARSIENMEAVTRFLADQGFTRIYMEDLAIGEQWSTLAFAKEIVGIHGAGLANLGFSIHNDAAQTPRFRLVELFSPGFSSSCFRDYAGVLDGRWVGVRGRITPEVVQELDILDRPRAHENACFTVDLDSLSEALEYVRQDA